MAVLALSVARTAPGTWGRLVVGGAAVNPDGLHVGSVSGTDGEAVYFTATDERDPTERHLWRYDPGQGLSRCSADPGVHDGEAAGGTVVVLSRTEAGAAAVAWRDGTRRPSPVSKPNPRSSRGSRGWLSVPASCALPCCRRGTGRERVSPCC